MASKGTVQLLPDSTGKIVETEQRTEVEPEGVQRDLQREVVVVDGLERVIAELKKMNDRLARIEEHFNGFAL